MKPAPGTRPWSHHIRAKQQVRSVGCRHRSAVAGRAAACRRGRHIHRIIGIRPAVFQNADVGKLAPRVNLTVTVLAPAAAAWMFLA